MKCGCEIPNRANNHLEVIYVLPDSSETASTDIYLCDEHIPNVPDGTTGLDNPYTLEWAKSQLKFDGWENVDVIEMTLTHIRD